MIFIGIDCDVEKSGYAVWNSETKSYMKLLTVDFWGLIEKFDGWEKSRLTNSSVKVIIEAGHLNKSVWMPKGTAEYIIRAKNRSTGMQEAIIKLITAYLDRIKLPYELVKPSKSRYRHLGINKGKSTAEQFRNITKWTERTNQEMRDAALLVWNR